MIEEINIPNKKHMKNKQMNEKLLYLFYEYSLYNLPFFIVSHQKVKRAITFHFAPRIEETNNQSLIFTDMIIGYVKSRARAVQAVGRMNGVIAQHLNYWGNLWFWIDQRTKEIVLRDIRITRHIEDNSVVHQSISLLHEQASADTPKENITSRRDIRSIGPFNNLNECKEKLKELLSHEINVDSFMGRTNTKGYFTSGRLTGVIGSVTTHTELSRIILDFINEENNIERPKLLSEISLSYSINEYLNEISQNFIIIPVYPNERSMPNDVEYIARYEEPMRDSNGKVLFTGNKIKYKENEYLINTIDYSKDGIPSRISIKNNNGEVIKETFIGQNSTDKILKLDIYSSTFTKI